MKLLAIDGNSILNRAFYGVRLLSNDSGIYTNAIFGFLNILLKLNREFEPDATAIAFDISRRTFRNDQYEEYKANRKGMPEELLMQLPLIQEILRDMGYRLITCEGYEGDDILGTLASQCTKDQNSCVIATGDRDCLQLVNSLVSVSLQKTKESILYTPEKVKEDFGFHPIQIIDMKALMGDSSDNIPGIKGIGEKTALSFIQQYGTLEKIYENLDAVQATPRIKKLLAEGKEIAFLSKKLATICLEVPISAKIEDYVKGEPDEKALAEILERLNLNSFFDKLNVSRDASRPQNQEKISFAVIHNPSPCVLSQELEGEKQMVLLWQEGLLKLCIKKNIFLFEGENAAEALKLLLSKNLPMITFKAKPLYKASRGFGYSQTQIAFDAELAAYLLSPSSKGYALLELAQKYLSDKKIETEEGTEEIASLFLIWKELEKELIHQNLMELFRTIEMPLCEVLADMEEEGFAIDKKGVVQFGEKLNRDIELTTEQIYRLAGEEFNINSTRELGTLLFEKLALPATKKTKTGYSTSVEVLEELMDKHPIVPQIMEYRKLTKLYSTYVVGLIKVIQEDGRVHSTFNQTETRTGRISSTEPNVQNIPIRTPLGSEMRRFFVAREGYTLIDADYSQIELRILAHIAKDQTMQKAFRDNVDIHAVTASQVFNHPLETLPAELRSRAKAINFGIVYGIGAYSLSRQINVSTSEAKEYIEAYLRTYQGVADYQKEIVEQARKEGYVHTLYGRRRELSDIRATNKTVRAFAERIALNTPVQGTAADIIKLAMIRVHNRIQKEGLNARLILQVHDELIVETPVMQAQLMKEILKEEMEHAAKLDVPLVVDIHIGKNWYVAKS